MHLRRSSEPVVVHVDADAWDGLPSRPAASVVIRAPRAGDLVAPAEPVRAA